MPRPNDPAPTPPPALRVAAALAVPFGLVTVVVGGRTLLGAGTARADAGAYVPFVLWFNSVAGLAYVAAGAGLWRGRRWAARLSAALAALSAVVYVAFGVHVAHGGAFERRTAVAMAVRTAFWIAVAGLAWRHLTQAKRPT